MKELTFAKLIEYLEERFEVIGLDDLLSQPANGRDSPRPQCLITFDDGWRDNYTRAYAWLKKYRMPATIFLATGFIGGRGAFWVERLVRAWKDPSQRSKMGLIAPRVLNGRSAVSNLENLIQCLKQMPSARRQEILDQLTGASHRYDNSIDRMLSWDEVIEMSRSGIEFGAHTLTHPLLTYETDATVERELAMDKQILEEKLDKRARAFAYPNGDWDSRVRQRVETAGYQCAFTTRPGWHRRGQDPWTIRRILLHEGNVTGGDGRFSAAMFNLTLAGSP